MLMPRSFDCCAIMTPKFKLGNLTLKPETAGQKLDGYGEVTRRLPRVRNKDKININAVGQSWVLEAGRPESQILLPSSPEKLDTSQS